MRNDNGCLRAAMNSADASRLELLAARMFGRKDWLEDRHGTQVRIALFLGKAYLLDYRRRAR